ncbi:MAG: hypothetical protein TECD_00093 [Hyphomicrobiaceae bacterium hypho_1]
MILRIIFILIANLLSFVIGIWVGNIIWPSSIILGAIIGALFFGGFVIYLTRDIRRK